FQPELASDGYPLDALREKDHHIVDLSMNLARMIAGDCQASGERFDKMLLIPRGSYPPANTISRVFGFDASEILHAGITHYTDGETVGRKKFKYGQMPTPEEIAGQDLLVIEEVCDTGETLSHLYDLLALAGAGLVRTGVLHYKPGKSTTGFKPDWWAWETNEWIVYPWEPSEKHANTLGVSVKRRTLPS
ncbi:MAG: hypothetical protein M3Q70_01355, partial [bacterium]|nr:hypothetical protein [bacterium]